MYVSRIQDKHKRLPHETSLTVRCFMTAELEGKTPLYSTDASFEHDKAVASHNGYTLVESDYESKRGLSFDEACTIMLQRFREQYPDEAHTSELLVVGSALPDLCSDSTPAIDALEHLDSLKSGIGVSDAGSLTLHECISVARALSASQNGAGVIVLLIDQGMTLAVEPQVDFSEAPVLQKNHVALIKVEAFPRSEVDGGRAGKPRNATVGRPSVITGLASNKAVAKAAHDLLEEAAQSGTRRVILDAALMDLLQQNQHEFPDILRTVRTVEHGRYATGHMSELARVFHAMEQDPRTPNLAASLAWQKEGGRLALTLWDFAEASLDSETLGVPSATRDEREKSLV